MELDGTHQAPRLHYRCDCINYVRVAGGLRLSMKAATPPIIITSTTTPATSSNVPELEDALVVELLWDTDEAPVVVVLWDNDPLDVVWVVEDTVPAGRSASNIVKLIESSLDV